MSFFAYMLGLSALFACDLVVTRVLPSADIALWAEARALIGSLGVIAALGLDLGMVRSPQSSIRMLGFAAVQVPLLAVLLGFGGHSLGYLSSPLSAAILAAGSASGLILGQFYRAHHRYLPSQLVQQAWKIVALVALGAMLSPLGFQAPPIDLVLGGRLLVTSLLGAVPLMRSCSTVQTQQVPESPAVL